jgi:hypothetical protein
MLQGPPPPPVTGGGLADLLGAGGPGGPPPPGGPGMPLPTDAASALAPPDGGQGTDPLAELQSAIETMHDLMRSLPDPADTDAVAQALKILTGVQKRQMTSGPAQAPASGQ